MIGLDTNILVRYLAQDDPDQSKQATRYIEKHCTDETPCLINAIVLCELAWVLEQSYKLSREQIAGAIEHLLQIGQLEVSEPAIVWRALQDYRSSNVDFPDHLIGRVNQDMECDYTITFDKKAAKQPTFKLI